MKVSKADTKTNSTPSCTHHRERCRAVNLRFLLAIRNTAAAENLHTFLGFFYPFCFRASYDHFKIQHVPSTLFDGLHYAKSHTSIRDCYFPTWAPIDSRRHHNMVWLKLSYDVECRKGIEEIIAKLESALLSDKRLARDHFEEKNDTERQQDMQGRVCEIGALSSMRQSHCRCQR